jgi:hypothetical protein
MPNPATGPASDALSGVRVLDFTSVMAGPFASRMLADLGAGGQDRVARRRSGPRPPAHARWPQRLFRPPQRRQAIACLQPQGTRNPRPYPAAGPRFDIVIENFRPGVMARFGLDYTTLSALNPRLIYCSISGYGQSGPKAHHPAYAL